MVEIQETNIQLKDNFHEPYEYNERIVIKVFYILFNIIDDLNKIFLDVLHYFQL
jgi:hypothetical protein